MTGIAAQYDSDLADMTNLARFNDGVKYFMATIGVFSRYLWVVPMKGKTSSDALTALKELLRIAPIPRLFRTDKGGEFTGRRVVDYLKQTGIHHFVTQNEPKANYSERVLKTIKGRITRHFTHSQSYRYIDVLPEIVKAYNDTYHSTIKMAPSAVNRENELSLWRILYPPIDQKSIRKRKTVKNTQSSESKKAYTFNIGDHVRLSHLKKTFDREYHDQK